MCEKCIEIEQMFREKLGIPDNVEVEVVPMGDEAMKGLEGLLSGEKVFKPVDNDKPDDEYKERILKEIAMAADNLSTAVVASEVVLVHRDLAEGREVSSKVAMANDIILANYKKSRNYLFELLNIFERYYPEEAKERNELAGDPREVLPEFDKELGLV